jgi:hypothetical protein
MSFVSFETIVEIDGVQIPVVVSAHYERGRPATNHFVQDDPPEVQVVEVMDVKTCENILDKVTDRGMELLWLEVDEAGQEVYDG